MRRALWLAAGWSACVWASGAGAQPAAKPLINGLMSMEDVSCALQSNVACVPDNSMADVFGDPGKMAAVVINVTWAQLQPGSGSDFDPSAIDTALATLAQYNAAYPATPLVAILRVLAGPVAPVWAQDLAGGPVQIVQRDNGNLLSVGLFWTTPYRNAWRSLQARLAQRYDANPLIAQVSDTSCSHQTDEPYVNPTDSASIIALFNAGYSDHADYECLLHSVHDYDRWQATRIDFTQNPFEKLSETMVGGVLTGVYGPNAEGPTYAIMQAFRTALGARAVLSNHNLNDPVGAANGPLYQRMQALGAPIEFQTASPGVKTSGGSTGKLKNWTGAVGVGVDVGATAIELWPSRVVGGQPVQDGWDPIACPAGVPPQECSGRTPAELRAWTRWLRTGVVGGGGVARP